MEGNNDSNKLGTYVGNSVGIVDGNNECIILDLLLGSLDGFKLGVNLGSSDGTTLGNNDGIKLG